MKERSFWKNSFGFIFGIVFMLMICRNAFAGTGWDGGYICLLPERATSDSVTLKWREPDGDDYCHEAFMSGFRSNYGADGYTDVSYSLKYNEYRGSFDGPNNSYRKISLSSPGSVTIHNLGHRLYVAYLVGRFHLDNGRYVERTTGMCVFQPYDGSKQSYEVYKNISSNSIAIIRLTPENESSWEYVVQYTTGSTFYLPDGGTGNAEGCINNHNESQYFYEGTTLKGGLYAGANKVITNLTPNTHYNIRVIPLIGVGDSWYDGFVGEFAFDFDHTQELSATTKHNDVKMPKLKNLRIIAEDGNSDYTHLRWKVSLNGSVIDLDSYEMEYTNLSNGLVLSTEWTNGKHWKAGSYYLPYNNYDAYFFPDAFYKVRIRGAIVTQGGYIYTNWTNYTYFCPQQTSKKDVKLKPTKRTIKATWKKVAGASNYTIYISDTPRGTYRKVATTSKTSYTIKKFRGRKLQSKKRYYLKIVANKKVGSKVYRSNSNYYIKTKTK